MQADGSLGSRRTQAMIVVAAGLVLLGAWIAAGHRPPPRWEVHLTRTVNDAPDWVAHGLWPVMQLGTLLAPVVLALLVGVLRRDWLLAGCVLVAGLLAWFGARVVKQIVGRGRPHVYLHDIVVRTGPAHGHGFVSGHAAVAAATLVVVMVAVPRRARPWLGLAIGLVGLARVVDGVHFPLDVVGGWALGVIVGVAVVAAYDRFVARRSCERA